jgi:hypothetical protein
VFARFAIPCMCFIETFVIPGAFELRVAGEQNRERVPNFAGEASPAPGGGVGGGTCAPSGPPGGAERVAIGSN